MVVPIWVGAIAHIVGWIAGPGWDFFRPELSKVSDIFSYASGGIGLILLCAVFASKRLQRLCRIEFVTFEESVIEQERLKLVAKQRSLQA